MSEKNKEDEIALPENDEAQDEPVSTEETTTDIVEPPPHGLLIATHIEARGLALAILASVALIFALKMGQNFFVPVLFGIFISYTLNPVVVWLEGIRVPRLVGASLVMIAMLGGIAAVGNALHGEFQAILEELPASAHKISRALEKIQDGQPSAIQKMQAAATEIEKAAIPVAGAPKITKKTVVADQSSIRVSEWVLAGSMGVLQFVGQATMVAFLVFFFLLSGDTFKRKLVKLTGPSLSKKKITVHILDDINTSIQSYMFMLLVTNTLLALLMWGALRWIGLQNAGAWAVVAGLLHVIPYFGPLLITASTAVSAFMQFESISMALLVSGASLTIATLVGTFVTTWMTGRIAKMNAAAVFISLLFWGWLWGIWGMLLGVPVVVIIKVVSERIEGMEYVAELLGD